MSIPECEYIWFDGELVPWREAKIHVLSHVVHYGSSVFEGMRCYGTPEGPAIFRLEPHLRRMVDSCRVYRMPIPYSTEQLG
ncbi:MAG: branched chain amino acid aminotransferase, partial [Chloroflexi bacterium]|nr:branched chain amino acid aminotransferase [Chloroflexota bacterium]